MNNLFKKGIFTVIIPVRGETDNYEVTIRFEGVVDELHKQMRTYKDFDIKTVMKTLTGCFDRQNVFMHCSCPDFCLEENTKIRLLNNDIKTIKEIKEMYDNGEEIWVYSIDEQGNPKHGKVNEVWVSGYAHDMIKVTLDNGESIITTPNHRYMLRDGRYEEAQNLIVGQSLMPLHFGTLESAHEKTSNDVLTIEKIHYDEEIPVYDVSVDKYNNFYVDAGAVLHNCYRFAYWSTKNKYNSGPLQPSNGKWIRNPHDKLGACCKHGLLVLSNNSWILLCARVIFNYVEWMKEHKEQMYAEQIYPVIYEKEYEDPYQTDILNKDELDSDEEEIKQMQKHKGRDEKGRFNREQEKGQFKKSNNRQEDETEEGEEEQ